MSLSAEQLNTLTKDKPSTLTPKEVLEEAFKNKTIAEVIEEFVSLKKSHQTQRAYRNDLTKFFNGLNVTFLSGLATIPFDSMTQLVKGYLNTFQKVDPHQSDKVLNPKTIRRKAYSLSSFFEFIIHVYNYPKNPVKFLDLPKDRLRSNTHSMTLAELRLLLSQAKENHILSERKFRDYLILSCLFILALRRNELAKLQWSDINADNHSISVYQKGGSYKELPLPKALFNLLQEFKECFPTTSAYIFRPTQNNRTKTIDKPIDPDLIWRIVKKLNDEAFLEKNITPHSFRKSFIEIALDNHQDFISIINATGHSTVEMLKYYDTRDVLKNNAINSIGNLV